ncbi:MAG: hypothetical protein WAU01_06355 [Saprospiraceae bacterium]
MYQDKKIAGLWIDHSEAVLISAPDKMNVGEFDFIEKIKSGHKSSRGSSENVQHNKKNQELTKFFKEVGKHITDFEVIFLVGPGVAQEEFRNFAQKDSSLRNITFELGSADTHLTHNQIVARVRDHFKL